ncbi:VOC family protein [Microbispora sp. H10670]|uniref:VOC family protein n=1 Tax=Microbispora sp. H10670 TaxID=2729108 RepID=UPI001602B870|nr:VOC family protein [Microbispora sp. H10670]
MTITLNHTIVPAADNREAARFFASIMGLEEMPPAGCDGHFAPVRVNDTLTLDFMTVDDPVGVHLAFDVDPATFDRILARLREARVPYGSDPAHPGNGRIDHPLCPRGLFFVDSARNLYEVMSPA